MNLRNLVLWGNTGDPGEHDPERQQLWDQLVAKISELAEDDEYAALQPFILA